jgi:predicted small integral membrane protein
MKLQKYITRKTLIFILSIIAIVYGGFLWDLQRLDKDFDQLFLLLRTARVDALYMETIVIVKFNGSKVTVINQKDSKEMTRTFSTIAKVDYDTTMGKNMIVYDRYGTGEYNKRVHGGEIMLRSLLGFRRYIHVNCTGLVTEGRYPEDIK